MRKKIVIISIVLIGFIFAVTSNSWAARDKGGHRYQDRSGQHQKWNKPADRHFRRDYGPRLHPERHHFKPKPHRRYHRPANWKLHPKRFHQRHHRPMVKQINNYYGSVESESVPEDDYRVTASISEAEFSFSIGISGSR